MICERCGEREGQRYRRNTAYQEEEQNYAVCCEDCKELDHSEMEEQWQDYYLSQGVYIKR